MEKRLEFRIMRFDPKKYKKQYEMRKNHFAAFSLVLTLFVALYLKHESAISIVGMVFAIPAWLYGLMGVLFTRGAYRDVVKWDKMGINEL
jgi:hypothetical protein